MSLDCSESGRDTTGDVSDVVVVSTTLMISSVSSVRVSDRAVNAELDSAGPDVVDPVSLGPF